MKQCMNETMQLSSHWFYRQIWTVKPLNPLTDLNCQAIESIMGQINCRPPFKPLAHHIDCCLYGLPLSVDEVLTTYWHISKLFVTMNLLSFVALLNSFIKFTLCSFYIYSLFTIINHCLHWFQFLLLFFYGQYTLFNL